jgi:hypothetical protein
MPSVNGQRAASPKPSRTRTIQDLRDAAARYRGELPDEVDERDPDEHDDLADLPDEL